MTSWIFELHYRNSSVGRTPNGKKIAADKAGVAVTDHGHGNILGGGMDLAVSANAVVFSAN